MKDALGTMATPERDGLGEAPGHRVRMFRRPLTSGVLEVHSEYAASAETARERVHRLRESGWRDWPPPAAPELTETLAHAHPDLRDCPFLLPVSEEPSGLLVEPRRRITCIGSLGRLEQALERESVLHSSRGEAIPCLELRSLRVAEVNSPRVRELRRRCKGLGIAFEMTGRPVENSQEVKRRTDRNRRPVKEIRQ